MRAVPFPEEHREVLKTIQVLSQERGTPVFIVGGVLREYLRGNLAPPTEYDLVMEASGIEFAEALNDRVKGEFQTFDRFLTAKCVLERPPLELDFVTARSESYPKPGALPVVKVGSLDEDLRRRDFTCNAMSIELGVFLEGLKGDPSRDFGKHICDPMGGRADLELRLIRVHHDASFRDDPTRIFRALRYVSRIGGMLERHTERLLSIALQDGALQSISTIRRWNEIRKIAYEKDCKEQIDLLSQYKVFEHWGVVPRQDRLLAAIDRFEQAREAHKRPGRIFEFVFLLSLPLRDRETFCLEIQTPKRIRGQLCLASAEWNQLPDDQRDAELTLARNMIEQSLGGGV